MSLYDLAQKHGTDKSGHGYCGHYEKLISPKLRLLEMGIGGEASSLRMWREWLPGAEIVGFDTDSGCCEKARSSGFEAIQGNQSNIDDLAKIPGKFNIIVDDAGHDNEAQKVAFKYLWPNLLPEGWYIIVDLQATRVQNAEPESVEAIAKLEDDVKEVHHIKASGGSAILFLKKA
jgi:hypothetical protein